eukprot:CAMPEP_0172366478 /NCGR_PEP_ID=MMETSP1060-20121228/15538_1 /TAXON_ID=37318 /ORGANISM="Pseudo-nitzschia pungens, Strain cf. cingulata" /LENGTH=203 /DNA_ID=CAMNT_0013090355 /DNA_START=46 /DNA_END=657 /DNA_ORIENTATION=-
MAHLGMFDTLINGAASSSNDVEKIDRNNLRRRTEEVDYWKQKAGWFDDDISMKEYNTGVYDTYYAGDASGSNVNRKTPDTQLSTGLKIAAAVLSIVVAIVVFRVLSRRSSKKKVSSTGKHKSSSESRSHRSRSRSRSGRSRSRTRRTGTASNYELMDDKSDRSRKSGRSRSRSRRSRSKSRSSKTRSKSKSRAAKAEGREVLV